LTSLNRRTSSSGRRFLSRCDRTRVTAKALSGEVEIEKIAKRDSSQPVTLTFEFLEYLRYYNWPGNVRELAQLMEQVVSAAGPGRKLFPIFLPPEICFHTARILAEKRKENHPVDSPVSPNSGPFPCYKEFRQQTMKEAESQYFRDLLESTDRNIAEACRISGLSRARLYQQLNRAGITGKESD
jgi:two-component system, NtrC family, response regulator